MPRSRRPPRHDRLRRQHDLRVYQEELQVQNEELARARTALEESRDHFMQLYESAPTAYLTLDLSGVIIQINATAETLFGRERRRVEGMPLLGFLARESSARYLDFLRLCREQRAHGRAQVNVEVTLRVASGPKDVQIVANPGRLLPDSKELLVAIIDITERRRIEAERARAFHENARLASRLISAQDEERQRIARDLHDNLGQRVTALRLLLQGAAMQATNASTRQRLEQTVTLVEELDRELDFMSGELRPASLDLGLASAIERFVHEWSATFGVASDVWCSRVDELGLGRDAMTHIYRIVQEALHNVFKHAKATKACVRLQYASGELLVSVEDNGRGFDSEAQSSHQAGGLGLLGMRERAHLIGGRLEVESAAARGTKIRLHVPVADRPESR